MISDTKHEKSSSISSSDHKLDDEENLPAYSPGTAGVHLSVNDDKKDFDSKVGATPFDTYLVPNRDQGTCAHFHNATPAEPAPLLDHDDTQRLRRITIAILVLSKIAAVLLLVNFVTILTGPFTKIYSAWVRGGWDGYFAIQADLPLMIVMIFSFLYTLCSVIHNTRRPKLSSSIRTVLDLVFFANIVPQTVRLVNRYPKDNWCHTSYMVDPQSTITVGMVPTVVSSSPEPDCYKWRLLCRVLTVFGVALGVVVAVLYLVSAIYRAVVCLKAWKRGRK